MIYHMLRVYEKRGAIFYHNNFTIARRRELFLKISLAGDEARPNVSFSTGGQSLEEIATRLLKFYLRQFRRSRWSIKNKTHLAVSLVE
jgi:hypothetical protein